MTPPRPSDPSPRRGRSLRIPALLLLITALAALALLSIQGRFRLTALLPDFLEPRRITSSWSVLREIRDLQELETASYHMKVVFPFDFTRRDTVDWTYLKLQYDRDINLFMAKTDPAAHPGGRLPLEWEHAELYHICRAVGIDPGRLDYRFIVLSAVFTAGVDMDAWLAMFGDTALSPEAMNPAASEGRGAGSGERQGAGGAESEKGVRGIRIQETEDGGRILEIIPPPVGLTSFFIEDRDASREGFPDIPLSPEEFRILSDFMLPRLREMALSGGLIEEARTGALSFLTEIFTAAGFDTVEFSPQGSRLNLMGYRTDRGSFVTGRLRRDTLR